MLPLGARAWSRGSAPILLVLLLLPLAAAAAAAWHWADDAANRTAQRMEVGRAFGAWVLALHRATQESRATWPADLSTTPPATLLITAAQVQALGGAPVGLPTAVGRSATWTFGILDDDNDPATTPDTPMAWGVVEFDLAADVGPAALGASEFGLAEIAVRTSGADIPSPVAAHLGRIENALGRPIGQHALYATADHAVAYHATALYRRAQPGRPWLSTMDQALLLTDGAGDTWDVQNAAAVATREARFSANAATNGGINSRVDADLLVGTATAPGSVQAQGTLTVDLMASQCLQADGTPVTGDCVTTAPAVTVSAGPALLADRLDAARVDFDGRLEAGALQGTPTVSAGIVAAGARATAGTRALATRSLTAGEFDIAGPLSVTGPAASATLQTGSLDAGSATAGPTVANSAFGPAATISGLMTVGSCSGCDWDGTN